MGWNNEVWGIIQRGWVWAGGLQPELINWLCLKVEKLLTFFFDWVGEQVPEFSDETPNF